MMRWIPLLLATLPTWAGAVELATILETLRTSGIPDTVEYGVSTTFQVAGRPITTTMKVLQSGPTLHWSESTVGGRTLRIVRNGDRQRILDVGSGESHTMKAPPVPKSLATDWKHLSTASWSTPARGGADVWMINQLSDLDSGIAGRRVEWSENRRLPSAMVQWDAKGDSTRAEIRWNSQAGRNLPEEIRVKIGSDSSAQTISMRFTDWRFPRSIPVSFFAIP